jgi:hypothetical protein
MTIDATGGGVIQMDSLSMKGGATVYFDEHVPSCSEDVDSVATLEVISNPGDRVVFNVDRLRLGNCARLTWNDDTIVNVTGSGAGVKIGVLVRTPIIVAPGRKVDILGAADDVEDTTAAVYARSLKMRGFVDIEGLPCL